MRAVIALVLTIFALSLAFEEGNTWTWSSVQPPPTSDDVELTILDSWTVTWASQALGLDVVEDGTDQTVIFSDQLSDAVNSLDPDAGGAGSISFPLYGPNNYCFGIAWGEDSSQTEYCSDDWSASDVYYTEDLVDWSTYNNPVGSNGRGMAFDGTDWWIAGSSGSNTAVCRFEPGGSSELFGLPEIPTQLSGLAAYPYDGDIYLAVTAYKTYYIYFYVYDGSSVSFLASAPCPAGCSSSLGLAYSQDRGTLFWSYSTGTYTICELSVEFTDLSEDTWGSIKSSF